MIALCNPMLFCGMCVSDATDVNLGHDRHRDSERPLVQKLILLLDHGAAGRIGKYFEQAPGRLDAPALPRIIE